MWTWITLPLSHSIYLFYMRENLKSNERARTWSETLPAVFSTAYFQPGHRKISPDSTKLHCERTSDPVLAQQ